MERHRAPPPRLIPRISLAVTGPPDPTTGAWREKKKHQPYVWVSITEELVEDVAEFPTEDSVAGERQAVHDRPEGVGSFLVVRPQDAWYFPRNERMSSLEPEREVGTLACRIWQLPCSAAAAKNRSLNTVGGAIGGDYQADHPEN
uniref:Uncharacterized protein n=1 Tax=Sphaerodactylus townsendi TaxID=933632 RepID=A0ACB8EDV6_9SAUR